LELHRRSSEIATRNDVVAFENRAGLVSAQLHRDALWNASPNHVPNGGPAEIVGDASGTSSRDAGSVERLV